MASNERTLRATIRLVDNYTRPMQNVVRQTSIYQKVASKIKPLVVKAKDMASKVLALIKAKIDKLKATKTVQTLIKAKDMASKVISKVLGGMKKFGGMVASATVKVLDKASSVIDNIKGKLMAIGSLAVTATVGMGTKELASEQTQKLTISRVIQNSGQSKEDAKKTTDEYYKYLEDYANKTPFETSAVAQFGTKAMMMAKGNVDNAKQYTDAMGNVKAFVGDLRTETEVAEAFFSASNGNMDMLNNMLGTQYKTFEEAQKGIAKNQGGLVEEMSTTIGGLMSTITGKAKVGMKNFMKAFQEPLTNSLNGVISFVDVAGAKMQEFAEKVAGVMSGDGSLLGDGIIDDIAYFIGNIPLATQKIGELASEFFNFELVKDAIKPVMDIFTGLMDGVINDSPVVSGIIQILGSVWNVVWSAIGSVINAVRPIVEKIFVFIGEHGQEISAIVQALGAIWNAVWNTVGALLQGAWTIVEPILSKLFGLLEKVANMVKSVGQWWTDMVNKIKNNPITEFVGNAWNSLTGGGRSAYGTRRVTGNDVPYRLHDGERVLTANEARMMDSKGSVGGGVSINISSMTIREEADIDKVANKLVRKIKEAQLGYSGVMG